MPYHENTNVLGLTHCHPGMINEAVDYPGLVSHTLFSSAILSFDDFINQSYLPPL